MIYILLPLAEKDFANNINLEDFQMQTQQLEQPLYMPEDWDNNPPVIDFDSFDPEENFLLDVDSYKASHWLQYPPGTSKVFSYIESRGGKYERTVFYGLQIYLKKYLSTRITKAMVDQAEIFFYLHGEPFNRIGWDYIVNECGGKLPIEVRAVKEGTVIPFKNAMVTIVNTDDNVPWLTSYIETSIHRATWYPVTVASNSWATKQLIRSYMHLTADAEAMAGLDFMLHDFGARGVSSKESAGIGGSAHLVNFKGSDTVTGTIYAMKYYNTRNMVSFSVPAAEHSSITTWLKKGELDAYKNMLKQFGGKYPIISVVSDSYDIYKAVEELWGYELKEDVIKCGSMLVIRPDSGNPAEVVAKIALLLDSTFGSTVNDKGYKVLNNVRILQGDGINMDSIDEILSKLIGYNFSASNMVFGQGGALLQQVDRDTNQFAMKASYAVVDGVEIDVYKDPVTDSNKKSKKGYLTLYKDSEGEIFTDRVGTQPDCEELLETVFLNGEITKEYTFEEVREQVWATT